MRCLRATAEITEGSAGFSVLSGAVTSVLCLVVLAAVVVLCLKRKSRSTITRNEGPLGKPKDLSLSAQGAVTNRGKHQHVKVLHSAKSSQDLSPTPGNGADPTYSLVVGAPPTASVGAASSQHSGGVPKQVHSPGAAPTLLSGSHAGEPSMSALLMGRHSNVSLTSCMPGG